MIKIEQDIEDKVFDWLKMKRPERKEVGLPTDETTFRNSIGLHKATFRRLKRDYDVLKATANVQAIKDVQSFKDTDDWAQRDEIFTKQLYELATDPNSPPKYKELYARFRGMLIDKQETKVKIELSADDLAREHIANQRWLREHGYLEKTGVEEVQPKPPLLPVKLCVDTEPEHCADS